ncbi:MAG: hypothetical protein PHV34_11995 [Verrucomicrobiae bacterium]|nr:hypothetical protein [Verrucomicrobiae bacterium]
MRNAYSHHIGSKFKGKNSMFRNFEVCWEKAVQEPRLRGQSHFRLRTSASAGQASEATARPPFDAK